MHPTRRAVLGLVASTTTVTLAGCTGNGGDGGGTDAETTDAPPATDGMGGTATTTRSAGGGADATVQVASHPEYGDLLVGPDGMTLYTFDRDSRGEGASACTDGCASAWPPLTVDGEADRGESVTAELTTFTRASGETQVAAGGWPLYYFSSDQKPGDATGQGVNDVWWVVRPDGRPLRESSPGTGTTTETNTTTGTEQPSSSTTPAPY